MTSSLNRKQFDTAMSAMTVAPSVGQLHNELGMRSATMDHARVRRLRGVCSTTTLVVLFLSTLPVVIDAKPVCGSDEFYVLRQCFPCSACPDYLIVRRPCTHDSDTLCGPLYDFEFLNGGKSSGNHRIQPQYYDPTSPSSNSAVDVHSDNSGLICDMSLVITMGRGPGNPLPFCQMNNFM